ncbi:MAG: hypothetical protein A2Z72_00680 [Omnitrophica bacterium RBG_13_46_9]|nr:MAG: hypothetical protein A2Z72_00680 [Omnitrophica bacterium RBG_13_46_9]
MILLRVYDIAVVGAGAAGSMAAIRAGLHKKNVVLVERNSSIGRKILLTGKERCNLTNIASIDTFIDAFGRQGNFLRSAFSRFFNHDLIDFFDSRGLKMRIERQGRVFPATERACSVVEVLRKSLLENKVKLLFSMRLAGIKDKNGFFQLDMENGDKIYAKKVIFATGGASFRITGSSGDGFNIARKLGHTIVPLKPALVPLKTREPWVKRLQGLSLRNIRVTFSARTGLKPGRKDGGKKITSGVGEIVFTHFGVSGPLVLDLSGRIVSMLDECAEVTLLIDLKPALEMERLESRLLREFGENKNAKLKNVMKNLLPHRLIPVFLGIAGIVPEKNANQISRQERRAILVLLKALPLTVVGSLSLEEAMVTNGGISTKEIDPRTMESRILPGLYFAGEIIDGCASSGGYNLQQAFSTGYLAGEAASACAG